MHPLHTNANLLGKTRWPSLLNFKGHRYRHSTRLWPLS